MSFLSALLLLSFVSLFFSQNLTSQTPFQYFSTPIRHTLTSTASPPPAPSSSSCPFISATRCEGLVTSLWRLTDVYRDWRRSQTYQITRCYSWSLRICSRKSNEWAGIGSYSKYLDRSYCKCVFKCKSMHRELLLKVHCVCDVRSVYFCKLAPEMSV